MNLNSQFEAELKKRLNARRIEIAEILCEGQAVKDYPEYRRYVGEYQALTQVVDTYCSEINETLNQR